MIGLKCSMQRMREERNKYREMYERTIRDMKEEKRNRKTVNCSHRCYLPRLLAGVSFYVTRSQAVARIADRTVSQHLRHVTSSVT